MDLRITLSAVLAAALAAGCADMHGLAPQAALHDANRLEAGRSLSAAHLTPAAWPTADWWKRYGDPQLDRLVDEALAGSPTLRVAQARARRALALAQATKAALYPRVDGNASVERERFPQHGLVPPPYAGAWATQAQLQATLDYELDLWGRHRAEYDAALGEAKAAEVDAYAARLALSAAIAQAYVQLGRAYEQLDVAQQALKERERFYGLTRERYDAGLDTLLAVKQAEAALPAKREEIAQWEEAIGLARNQLAALVGAGPDRGLAIERPTAHRLVPLAIPATLPAELLGRRPDIVAQRWRAEAAARGIDAAKAQFYPNVNLTAFIGLQAIGLPGFLQAGNRTLGAAPAVTLPIFDAGRLRGNLAARDAEYDIAVERYNQALADALRDVVDQLTSYRSVEAQSREQKLAQATAHDAYELALARFRAGTGNYLEVLTAEERLLAQQSLAVDLHARGLALSIDLVRALGGGYASTPGSIPVADARAAH
jgi:NodT family efflux transporter outer membrane factor (OMF) lipoprotein